MDHGVEPFFLLEGDQHGCLKVEKSGYYVDPKCTSDCCPAYGPFPDMVEARKWISKNLDRLTT